MSLYEKYKWQIVGKDFNSPFFRNYIWTSCSLKYPELFGVPAPVIGILSRKNAIDYIGDLKSWSETHEGLKRQALEDYHFVEKLIDTTNKLGEEFNTWSEENIFSHDLTSKTSGELVTLYKEFQARQAMLYAYGITLPILDFQNFSFVEDNLGKILKAKVPPEEYQEYFDILTFPAHNSFAQDQEEDLLRLMGEFNSEAWRKDVLLKDFDEVSRCHPEFSKKLKDHVVKYAWVYYVYAGPVLTEVQFYEFIKEYVDNNIDPKQKLEEARQKRQDTERQKERILKNLNPNDFERTILLLAGKIVWAKPRRKDYQSRSYFHLEKLQREIARRLSVSLSQIRSAPIGLIEEGLRNGGIDTDLLNSIHKLHICLPIGSDEVVILYGKDAEEFYDKYVEKEVDANTESVSEISGATAYPGKAKGVARIINASDDMNKMERGDVLVSVATSPSIVPAMKKAAAIVTDEGGLTCHAAIVSRELGKPCVIGTKIATKVFKDGDLVEVDATKGVVRRVGSV